MNNSNPFVPQGSLLEQKNKKRARVKLAVFSIFALNILVITPLLIQGCSKKDTSSDSSGMTAGNPPPDTGAPADTNSTPALPPVGSNTVASASSNATQLPPTPPAPVPPPPAPPEVPSTHEYTIAKGDSFYSIGLKFNVKIKDIEAANPGITPAKLKVGQKIQLPAGGTSSPGMTAGADAGDGTVYVVKSGDSLTKIAKSQGISVKMLKTANSLKTDQIKVGQKLKVPAKAVTTPVDTTPATTTTSAVVPTPSAPVAPGTTTR